MKFLNSKLPGLIIMFVACIMFISIVWLTARTFFKTIFIQTPYMFLEGEYSIDDGEWKQIDMDTPINDTFKKSALEGISPI